MDIVKKTMSDVYLGVLKTMAQQWRERVGVGYRFYYFIDKAIQELEAMQDEDK